METLKNLEKSEMIEISGGVNPAYEIGYAIGSTLRELLIINGIRSLFLL
jgi:hypothetical protein